MYLGVLKIFPCFESPWGRSNSASSASPSRRAEERGCIDLWTPDLSKRVTTLDGHRRTVTALAAVGNELLSGSAREPARTPIQNGGGHRSDPT